MTASVLDQPQTIDLRIERLNRTILALSLPSVAESLLSTMVYMVDTILIGWLNEPSALAAVGLSGTLMWASDGLFRAISISASAMVARYWGQRDFEEARRVAGQLIGCDRVDDGLQVGSGSRNEDGNSCHRASQCVRATMTSSVRESCLFGKPDRRPASGIQ